MHRLGLIVIGLIGVALVGVLLVVVVVPRARARAQSDWLKSNHLSLEPVIKGLKEPTYVAGPPDGTNRLFVLERTGFVRVAAADGQLRSTPFLDLSQQVSLSGEEGLLGLAFPSTVRPERVCLRELHGHRLVGSGHSLHCWAQLS